MRKRRDKGARVGPAVAIKVMSPPPKNVVVCLPVIGGMSLDFGQLRSEEVTQDQADSLVEAINGALKERT